MKKIFAAVIMFVMTFSAAIAFAGNLPAQQQTAQDVLMTRGTIQEISQNQLQIVGEGNFTEIILNVGERAHIVSGENGTATDFSKLKQGDKVTAYYGPRLTRSIPPQGQAIALILGDPDHAAMYMKAATVETLSDGSVRVLCSNGDRLVTIRPEVFSGISDIKEGSELLVWYQMMTLSLPGQATATKAILLNHVNIHADLIAGTLVIQGKETALHQNDTMIEKNGTVFLPLRTIAEQLGYTLKWNEQSKSTDLIKGAYTATVTVGSQDYGKSKMRVRLDNAPEIVNGKTLVPVEFFTEVLDVTSIGCNC